MVVPVYFNEGSLKALHQRLNEIASTLIDRGISLEMVFVDDGSGDSSFSILREIAAADSRVRVVRHARNFGSFPAIKTGLSVASGDCAVTLSADLQDPPELLLDMVARWQDGEKFVIAVRASREDPLGSRMFSAAYYRILRWLVIPDYPPGGFDFMLVDRLCVPYLLSGPKSVNLNLYAYWLGFKPSILPYDRLVREHGKSRWTLRKKVNLFVDTITGFSVRPIRIMSVFGLGTAALSFLYGLYVVLQTLLVGSTQPGFPTLAALVSFFSGLIIFMLGMIGEYLWRIFDAVNRKPEAVIAEVIK